MQLTGDFLTVPQAAARIGVTAGRVRQMLVDGEITGQQVPDQTNGRWLIPMAEATRVAKNVPTTGRRRSKTAAAEKIS